MSPISETGNRPADELNSRVHLVHRLVRPREFQVSKSAFTLQRLFVLTTMMAVGCGIMLIVRNSKFGGDGQLWIGILWLLLWWLAAGAILGASLCSLINRPWLGAIVGMWLQLVAVVLLMH